MDMKGDITDFFRLRQNNSNSSANTTASAKPPTTPPIIAPSDGDLPREAACVELQMECEPADKEQTAGAELSIERLLEGERSLEENLVTDAEAPAEARSEVDVLVDGK